MGIRLFGSHSSRRCCCSCEAVSTPLPNPDPKSFRIVNTRSVGRYCIAEIEYHGCTNFEGRKILVFRDIKAEHLKNFREIDPHFSESGISPIARFVPSKEGWNMAVTLCQAMMGEDSK